MPKFSKKSLQRLATCDPRLQEICYEAIKTIDFTVICGHRSQQEQDKAVKEGKSRLKWPHSKHNSFPSKAVDIAPIKYRNSRAFIDWEDLDFFRSLSGLMKDIAKEKGIAITWGGDWKTLVDMPHYELPD